MRNKRRTRTGERRDDDETVMRAIFTAAGGAHDDWPTYDRVMAEDRRAAVVVAPTRVYSNG